MIALLPRLRRFAFALTGSWPDADDLVQATCVRAIDRLEQWRAGSRLDSWMYRIAQNLHRNDRRNDRTRQGHLEIMDACDADVAAANRPTDRMTLRDVSAAIAALPAEQRAVLLLVAVEGYGYQDAAEILGTPPGTVASRLSRARAALAERFAEDAP